MCSAKGECEHHRRRDYTDGEDSAQQKRRRRPSEIQRPSATVARRHEERRILGVAIKLSETPMRRNARQRLRSGEFAGRGTRFRS